VRRNLLVVSHPLPRWPSLRVCASGVGVVLGIGGIVHLLLDDPPSIPGGVALVVLTTAPLLVLHRWPRTAVALSEAALLATILLDYPPAVIAIVALAPGLAAVRLGGRAAAPLAAASIAIVAVAPQFSSSPIAAVDALSNAGVVVLATVVGAGARTLRRYADELGARAQELEELRQVETREAVARERLRIARDVHDVVGHSLAAIALHARVAARRLHRDPDGAAQSLAEVSDLASSALRDTRAAVGELRVSNGPVELSPRLGLDDLDELVAHLRGSGLRIVLRRDEAIGAIPAVVQAAAFRILQESLSNVARHAPNAAATITLRVDDGELRVEVHDDGTPPAAPPGHGHGIVGMRERALSVGGSVHAGPAPDGGWRVTATLPVTDVRAAPQLGHARGVVAR
jgi:signal transduction histidine kinase